MQFQLVLGYHVRCTNYLGTRDHKFVDDVERMSIVLFPLMFDSNMVHITLESDK